MTKATDILLLKRIIRFCERHGTTLAATSGTVAYPIDKTDWNGFISILARLQGTKDPNDRRGQHTVLQKLDQRARRTI